MQLLEKPRTWKNPPAQSHEALGKVCEQYYARYLQASDEGNPQDRLEALLAIQAIPGKHLPRMRGGGNNKAKKSLIKLLTRQISGVREQSPQAAPRSAQIQEEDPEAEFTKEQTLAVNRAVTYASAGQIGKAAAALCSGKLADASDPRVQKQIAALFPRNPDPIKPQPVRPLPPVIIDPAEFAKKIIRPACKASGADAYGFTAEIIHALWKNPICQAGIPDTCSILPPTHSRPKNEQ
jgi:hypothetical protein